MIIEKIMSTDIISLTETDTIQQALTLIKEKKIRHIPIINEEGHLIGLVSDRDIRDAAPSIFQLEPNKEELKKPLCSIMKTNIITGHPLDFVEEAGAIFCENNISCLPIVHQKKLVGIITGTDLLHSYVELTGVNKPGSQIEVEVPDKAGVLYEIFRIFHKRHTNIHSVLVYPAKEGEQFKILVLRVETMNPLALIEDLRKEGYSVVWPELPGIPL